MDEAAHGHNTLEKRPCPTSELLHFSRPYLNPHDRTVRLTRDPVDLPLVCRGPKALEHAVNVFVSLVQFSPAVCSDAAVGYILHIENGQYLYRQIMTRLRPSDTLATRWG